VARNFLILDTDGGVDDAQALTLLIANGRAPDAITTVFGNVGLDMATNNMLATLAVLDAAIPVHKGADRPPPRPAVTASIASDDAIGFLRRSFAAAAARGEKVDILMIGPLTNLALALRLEPSIIDGIGTLTIMGGNLYGRGNITPAAEFNIYADPEAASIVFGAAIETVVVAWEPCTTHLIAGAEVDAIFAAVAPSPAKAFAEQLARHARTNIEGRTGGDVMFFVDPLAAAIVIDPAIVTRSLRASVEVALAPGITRGMTVVDPSGRLGTPMVTLLEEADVERVKSLYAVSAAYRS
jgi:purine nucleosidase